MIQKLQHTPEQPIDSRAEILTYTDAQTNEQIQTKVPSIAVPRDTQLGGFTTVSSLSFCLQLKLRKVREEGLLGACIQSRKQARPEANHAKVSLDYSAQFQKETARCRTRAVLQVYLSLGTWKARSTGTGTRVGQPQQIGQRFRSFTSVYMYGKPIYGPHLSSTSSKTSSAKGTSPQSPPQPTHSSEPGTSAAYYGTHYLAAGWPDAWFPAN